MFYRLNIRRLNVKTRQQRRVLQNERGKNEQFLLLPRALLMAVRLKALPAFVLRHLQTALLLEISHGESGF